MRDHEEEQDDEEEEDAEESPGGVLLLRCRKLLMHIESHSPHDGIIQACDPIDL